VHHLIDEDLAFARQLDDVLDNSAARDPRNPVVGLV
jgi:hypothetical protein